MRFSIALMLRLLALGSLGLTMLAVGVSRSNPPEAVCRIESPVTTVGVSDLLLGVSDRHPRWLDTSQGTMALTPVAGDDVLEVASCSPWVDARGHRQMVGRWSSRTFDGPETIAHDFGIARFSFPDGQVLDRVSLENVPCSPPCWLPGDRARVLYVTGDGRLRRIDFESGEGDRGDDPSAATQVDPRPMLIGWACAQPGLGEVAFVDIAAPRLQDGRLSDLLLATLRYKVTDAEQGQVLSQSEVWWLRLDPSSTQIVAAGSLLDSDPANVKLAKADARRIGNLRYPTLGVLPDGKLALAFAWETPNANPSLTDWSTGWGPLEIRPDGRPTCCVASIQTLNTQSHLTPFAFSPDGRWFNLLILKPDDTTSVARYPTSLVTVARLDQVQPAR